jgi:hypothetical protein
MQGLMPEWSKGSDLRSDSENCTRSNRVQAKLIFNIFYIKDLYTIVFIK